MTSKLKQGLITGLIAAAICTLLFTAFWYFTLPPDLSGSDHSISRWWRSSRVPAHLWLGAVVFFSSALMGFVTGAARPNTIRRDHKAST